MASVGLVVNASTRFARIALGELELFTRRTMRRIDDRIDEVGRRSRSMWRGMAGTATAALTGLGINASRILTSMADGFVSAASGGTKFVGVLGLLLAVLIPVVAILGNLLGLLILIPGGILGTITAFAAMKIAVSGVSEAIEAGLSGDIEKFKDALKKLHPDAQRFVQTVVRLAGAWRQVKLALQGELFSSSDRMFQRMTDNLLPVLLENLPKITKAINRAAQGMVEWFIATNRAAQVDTILRAIAGTTENIVKVGRPMLQIFLDLAEVGLVKINGLTRGLGDGAEKLAAWVRQAKESGQLNAWLEKALDTLSQLNRIVGNVMDIFKAMFKGGQEQGETMLDTIEKLTAKTAEWMNSKRGQDFIQQMGLIVQALLQIGAMAATLTAMWSAWFEGMKTLWKSFVFYALDAIGAVLNALVKVFGKIPGIGPLLKEAQANFNNFANGVRVALDSIPNKQIIVDVVYRDNKGGNNRNVPIYNNYQPGVGGRAAGGPSGGLTVINEMGSEVVKLPNGSMVYPAGQSKGMWEKANSGGNAGGQMQLVVSTQGTSDPMLAAIVRALRFEVRNGAGGDVVAYFGGA